MTTRNIARKKQREFYQCFQEEKKRVKTFGKPIEHIKTRPQETMKCYLNNSVDTFI